MHTSSFSFEITSTDWLARTGVLQTPHGEVQTPVFMPVGTAGTIKWITREGIAQMGTTIMLCNTYHLMLRPGAEIIAKMGGLHKFMNVNLPILTDSGGFQVFSLGNPRNGGESLVKTSDEGVEFQSHHDGNKHFITPEKAMEIQSDLGADIIMAFDDVATGDASKARAREALNRTHQWAERCVERWQSLASERQEKWLHAQTLFPIIQWVTYPDLRVESKKDMLDMLDVLSPELPKEKPHYLMGVGTPEDLVEAIARWVDMFDCVLPTRLGRHGEVFTSEWYLKINRSSLDGSMEKIPVASGLETSVSEHYTLWYLRHLMHADELLGQILLSMHNTEFLMRLCDRAREAIQRGEYEKFRGDFWKQYTV